MGQEAVSLSVPCVTQRRVDFQMLLRIKLGDDHVKVLQWGGAWLTCCISNRRLHADAAGQYRMPPSIRPRGAHVRQAGVKQECD